MRHVFNSQNELGRLCDEVVYRNDLVARLKSAGLGCARREVPVTVTYPDFSKTYRLDLILCDAFIYEFKEETRLVAEHESQLLNYLFLCGVRHGKLVNLRPVQVESRFVNTTLTPNARRDFKVDIQRWREENEPSQKLRSTLLELLTDWGGFLELSLYTEALVHQFGGEQNVVQRVALRHAGMFLGHQSFNIISPDIAFRLTALPEHAEDYELQLQALLNHSSLSMLQWINLARHRVQLVTLVRQK